jgi:putative hydrolase of the HAD superfamily
MQETAWLVFDLGGVLFDFHGVAGVSDLTGSSQDAAHELLVKSRAVQALETGEIDAELFGQQFSEELGVSISSSDMIELWASWETGPKPGAIELLKSLREQNPIACLSNNNAINWAKLCTHFDANHLFDKCYLSHEIGLQKPDPKLFEHVVTDLDTPPKKITYFDDRLDIIESATAFGFSAHQVSSPEDIRAVLERS